MAKTFSSLVRATRLRQGLSQSEFGKSLESSGQMVSNWERGYGPIMPIRTLRRLIEKFDLDRAATYDIYLNEAKDRLAQKLKSKLD